MTEQSENSFAVWNCKPRIEDQWPRPVHRLAFIPATRVRQNDRRSNIDRAMELKLPSDAKIRRDASRGTITFLRGSNLSAALEQQSDFRELQLNGQFAEIAIAFLNAHRRLFNLERPSEELIVKSVTTDDLGFKHVRLRQQYAGLPVWGAEIIVQLDRSNHVNRVQGRYIPTPSGVGTAPVLRTEEAMSIVAKHLTNLGSACRGCQAQLVIFVTGDNTPRLAYRVLVTVSLTEGWAIMVDAKSGSILEKLSTVYSK